jgi:hypothetical protein
MHGAEVPLFSCVLVGAEHVAWLHLAKRSAPFFMEPSMRRGLVFLSMTRATFGATASGAESYQFGAVLLGAEGLAIFLISFQSSQISLRS